jgi:hypothetical protein
MTSERATAPGVQAEGDAGINPGGLIERHSNTAVEQTTICPIACTGRTDCPLCLPGSLVTP